MKYVPTEILVKAGRIRNGESDNESIIETTSIDEIKIFGRSGDGIALSRFQNIKGTDVLYKNKKNIE